MCFASCVVVKDYREYWIKTWLEEHPCVVEIYRGIELGYNCQMQKCSNPVVLLALKKFHSPS
jgi:hypothetical protein